MAPGWLRQTHDRLREAERRELDPSGAVIDRQAVIGIRIGEPERGYDEAKPPSVRKRHLLVDTGGLVLGAHVLTPPAYTTVTAREGS